MNGQRFELQLEALAEVDLDTLALDSMIVKFLAHGTGAQSKRGTRRSDARAALASSWAMSPPSSLNPIAADPGPTTLSVTAGATRSSASSTGSSASAGTARGATHSK